MSEIGKFYIACKKCEMMEGLDYETYLNIDWKAETYTIKCGNCGVEERFNGVGDLIADSGLVVPFNRRIN